MSPTTYCISDAWTSSFAHRSARCRPIADMDGVPTTSPSTGKSCWSSSWQLCMESIHLFDTCSLAWTENPLLGYSILRRRGAVSFLGQMSQNIILYKIAEGKSMTHKITSSWNYLSTVLQWFSTCGERNPPHRTKPRNGWTSPYVTARMGSKISIEIIRFRLSSSESAAGHPKWRSKQLKLESCFVGSYSCQ